MYQERWKTCKDCISEKSSTLCFPSDSQRNCTVPWNLPTLSRRSTKDTTTWITWNNMDITSGKDDRISSSWRNTPITTISISRIFTLLLKLEINHRNMTVKCSKPLNNSWRNWYHTTWWPNQLIPCFLLTRLSSIKYPSKYNLAIKILFSKPWDCLVSLSTQKTLSVIWQLQLHMILMPTKLNSTILNYKQIIS